MSLIKRDHVSGEESPHERGDPGRAASEEEVRMVGDQRPCVAGSPSLRKEKSQAIKEIVPVFIGPEDFPPLYPTDHHVVQDSRCIEAHMAGHERG